MAEEYDKILEEIVADSGSEMSSDEESPLEDSETSEDSEDTEPRASTSTATLTCSKKGKKTKKKNEFQVWLA